MSWFNEFAGKAEDFLNKIDHGAATVLNKDSKKKKKTSVPVYTEDVYSTPPMVKDNYSSPSMKASPAHNRVGSPTPDIVPQQTNEDDRILSYLNDSAIDIDSLKPLTEVKKSILNHSPVKESNILVEDSTDISISVNSENENELLRNEVRSLNIEVALLMARTKSAERELALNKSILSKKEGDLVVLEKEVTLLKQRMTQLESENSELFNENFCLKKSTKETKSDFDSENKLSQYQLEAQRKEEALKGDIASLRIRIGEIEQSSLKERSEYSKELSEVNARLGEARKELDDYRARAQWTLAEKEKFISELQKERGLEDSNNVLHLEIQQLRDEKEKLSADLEEVREKLGESRKSEEDRERRLEAVRDEATSALRSAQARLAEETARRLAAEEHSASHAEELHSVREELWRQVGSLNSRLKEREKELSRLRRQLAERVISRPDPDLTSALVQKQESIEQLTGEIHQLRLQLDRARMQHGQQDIVKRYQTMNVNDTDDAKATFVGQLSRTVFLRRHPCARMLFFSYLIALHLWLCLVLFTYTPDDRQFLYHHAE